jgi:hypothetical protein
MYTLLSLTLDILVPGSLTGGWKHGKSIRRGGREELDISDFIFKCFMSVQLALPSSNFLLLV